MGAKYMGIGFSFEKIKLILSLNGWMCNGGGTIKGPLLR